MKCMALALLLGCGLLLGGAQARAGQYEDGFAAYQRGN